ncbi:unnamed protein product [Rangifer tarandus platyrhynchus]|uniref:Uncharacterized protein n=2 Tax=Rangifer tarandus platyrhynchus TaxID=3082113 RepID=A0ABN8ZX13_RANTA|nr:unnamed protein product [Rangifer tarandus platyrhynchus]
MQDLVCSLHCRATPALSSLCSGAPPSLRFSSAVFSSSTALLSLVPSVPFPAAWRDSPFAGFTGQFLSSFLPVAQGSCGEQPAPAGRVGQSLLLSATRAFEGRAAALCMKCCSVYSPVS